VTADLSRLLNAGLPALLVLLVLFRFHATDVLNLGL
jgi:hypothetical protein